MTEGGDGDAQKIHRLVEMATTQQQYTELGMADYMVDYACRNHCRYYLYCRTIETI